jgi:hypothetical protein
MSEIHPYSELQNEKSYRYGDMTIYTGGSQFSTEYMRMELGAKKLDTRRLNEEYTPLDNPEKNKIGILIDYAGLYGTRYDPEKHKIYIDEMRMQKSTFPRTFFEELFHSRLATTIDKQLTEIPKKGVSDFLQQNLPQEVVDLLNKVSAEYASNNGKVSFKGISDDANLGYNLAQELPARKLAALELMKWTDNDLSKIGLTEQQVAEATVLSLLLYAHREEDVAFCGGKIANLPPHENFEELKKKIGHRLDYYQYMSDPEMAKEYADSHNFFPDGTIDSLIKGLS